MINKRYIFIEILLLCFLTSVVTFGFYTLFHTNWGHNKEYHVVFHDVDGLIVGSPVRLMGINIGNVQKIQNLYDDVHLTFVISEKEIELPKKIVATIQFTGIAGSKSLELLPVAKCQQLNCSMMTIEPIRINKAFSIQNSIMESLVGYTKSVSEVIGQNSVRDTHKLLRKTAKEINGATTDLDELNHSLKRSTGEISVTSQEIQKSLMEFNNSLVSLKENPNESNQDEPALSEFNSFVQSNLSENNINYFHKKIINVSKTVKKINYEKGMYERFYETGEIIAFYTGQTSDIVNKATNFLTGANLENVHKQVKSFKDEIKKLPK
jgi:hypothetical protein